MLQTLRGRITISYVAFVMVFFLLVAAVLAREAVTFYTRTTNDAIAAAGNQIRQIAAKNPKRDRSLRLPATCTPWSSARVCASADSNIPPA